MNTDESVFDYLAAAEETAQQLDGMTKRIPGELKAALLEEWRKSSWQVELPKAMDEARAATERTESATRFLNRSVRIAGLAVCLTAVVIPLTTWGWAYWQTRDLRREQAEVTEAIDKQLAAYEKAKKQETEALLALRKETAEASALADMLRTGAENGGVILERYGENEWKLTIPSSLQLRKRETTNTGNIALFYTVPR